MSVVMQANQSIKLEQRYSCDLKFSDPGIGHILIFKDHDGTFRLTGKCILEAQPFADEISEKSHKEILDILQRLDYNTDFQTRFGRPGAVFGKHEDIFHNGVAYGGALCLKVGPVLYVNDFSVELGRMSGALLTECAKRSGFSVVFGCDLKE